MVEVGVAGDRRMPKIVVEDKDGRHWAVSRLQLEVGHAIYVGDEYCRETNPKAVLHLRLILRDLKERIRRETNEFHGSASWGEPDADILDKSSRVCDVASFSRHAG